MSDTVRHEPTLSGGNCGQEWWQPLYSEVELPPRGFDILLTNTTLRNLKPASKIYRKPDGRCLYIEVPPTGAKRWRFRYRFGGKAKQLSFGTFPDVGLKMARERREAARKLLADGVDPGEHRKASKASREGGPNTFEVVAREWFAKFRVSWSEGHASKVSQRLEQNLIPWLGALPMDEITTAKLLSVIRRIEDRGAVETAHRALQDCGRVFRYARSTGRSTHNPVSDLRGALSPQQPKHFAAVTEPRQVRELLIKLDGYEGTLIVCCALRLAPLVFVRPGELRNAQWDDVDLDTSEWRYFVTKTKTWHIVPLSRQAVDILRELHPLTGTGRFVFPGARSDERPMSNNAILAAMRSMGIMGEEMSGHGFRAMARTILDEVLGFPAHLIEHQLAHAVHDANGRAYNRTAHLPERRAMMQRWADYLDGLKAGGTVIPFPSREGAA